MSIEDFHNEETEWEDLEGDEQQEGLEVKVDPDGTVELVAKTEDAGNGKVTQITEKAQKKLDDAAKAFDPMAEFNEQTKAMQDDELPM